MNSDDRSRVITAISAAIHAFIDDEQGQHSYNRPLSLTPWQISEYSSQTRYHLQKPLSWSGRR